jgi:hypothetical protein
MAGKAGIGQLAYLPGADAAWAWPLGSAVWCGRLGPEPRGGAGSIGAGVAQPTIRL